MATPARPVAHPAVAELRTLLTDQPTMPMKPNQQEGITEELARVEAMASAPPYVQGHDRGAARATARRLRKMLDEQGAKLITDGRRDRVAALCRTLEQDVIAPALQTRAEMRRNPAGAVGKFQRTEGNPVWKDAVWEWKRARRALERDPDPDATNVERFRRESPGDTGASTFMAGAQIPGVFGMTPQARENWPLGEPTVETPLKQAQRAESPANGKTKKGASAKQLAALARARAARTSRQAVPSQGAELTGATSTGEE